MTLFRWFGCGSTACIVWHCLDGLVVGILYNMALLRWLVVVLLYNMALFRWLVVVIQYCIIWHCLDGLVVVIL